MGAVAERLVRRVTATAETGGRAFVRDLVPLDIKNGEVALDAE
jgi:hypothetical protein